MVRGVGVGASFRLGGLIGWLVWNATAFGDPSVATIEPEQDAVHRDECRASQAKPNTQPNITSVIQWWPRYTRLSPIDVA